MFSKVKLSLLVCCFLVGAPSGASEVPVDVEQIYKKVEAVILKYYPKATFARKDGFEARYNTRQFMIHHALKTGEWQEAHSQEGPNRGGILCRIQTASGPFFGAAMVPQTFDERYFQSLLRAPYSKRLNRHLISHLDYPSDASSKLIEEYSQAIDSFAK